MSKNMESAHAKGEIGVLKGSERIEVVKTNSISVERLNRLVNTGQSLLLLDTLPQTHYRQQPGSGLYFFVTAGQVEINGNELGRRDGLGLTETTVVQVKALSQAEVLCMDIPLQEPN